MPVPNQTRTAVHATASAPAASRLATDATQVPPEAAAEQGAEASGAAVHSSTQIEQDEAVEQGAHLECDLPGVVIAQVALCDRVLDQRHGEIGGRRAAGLEVARVAPCTGA